MLWVAGTFPDLPVSNASFSVCYCYHVAGASSSLGPLV